MNTFYEKRPEKMFIGGMTRYPVPVHVHEVVELFVITSGSVQVSVDGTLYALASGDTAVVFPLVPHSFESLSEDANGIIAIFPQDLLPDYASTFHAFQPEHPILLASETSEDFRHAVARLSALDMHTSLPRCIAYLHVLLAEVLPGMRYRPMPDYIERNLGYRIIQHVSEHAFEEITLESVSSALGVSVSYLSHFFSEKLRTNFRRFVNAIRIDRACMMMRDPSKTLTEICDACGYVNMRTFRRAFQIERGILPSEEMQAVRQHARGDSLT